VADASLLLFWAPGACSQASHVLLEQSGLPYGRRRVSLEGEQRTAAYLALHPDGRVPVLQIGEELLTESVAILCYVAGRVPERCFLPQESTLATARCLSLAAWIASTLHPAFRLMTRTARLSDDPACQRQIHATGQRTAWELLGRFERRLAGHGQPWMLGCDYSLCDPYALVFYGSGVTAGYPMHELAAFTAWKDRMLAIPAVRSVLAIEGSPLLGSGA